MKELNRTEVLSQIKKITLEDIAQRIGIDSEKITVFVKNSFINFALDNINYNDTLETVWSKYVDEDTVLKIILEEEIVNTTPASKTEKIFAVSEERVPQIEKLIKKAIRLGAKIDYSIKHTGDRLLKGTYTNKLIQIYTVTIASQELDIPEYDVLGKLEVTGIGNNIITSRFGCEFDKKPYSDLERVPCEHCNTNRLRKHLYIVQDKKTNEIITMGKACLKDLLKINNLDSHIKGLEAGFKLEDELNEICEVDLDLEEFEEYQKTCSFLKIESVLAYIKQYLSTHKYIPSERYVVSTSHTIAEKLYGYDIVTLDSAIKPEFKKNIEEDIEFFLANYDKENDFHIILKDILDVNKYIEIKRVGILAPFFKVVEFIKRKIEKEKERALLDEAKLLIEYYGTVGEKINVEAVHTRYTSYETQYGTTWLYFFKVDNHTLVWKTSKILDTEVGAKCNLRATIKEHSVYNGEKQTYIIRAKVEEV